MRQLWMALVLLGLAGVECLPADGDAGNMRAYTAGDVAIEAGFKPDKTHILAGEPLFITFSVVNRSDKPYGFSVDGDSGPGGRHDSFRVVAVGAKGDKVKDPHAGEQDRGGPGGPHIELKKGESYEERLFLGHWCALDKPDLYTVTCERSLDDITKDGRSPSVKVSTQFALEASNPDERKMGKIIAELGRAIREGDKQALGEATLGLSTIVSPETIPHLAEAQKWGDYSNQTVAIRGLSRYPDSEQAVQAISAALGDTDQAVRGSAATALGEMKAKRAVPLLTAVLKDEDKWVRRDAANALGKIGSREAINALKDLLQDKSMPLRLAAVESLKELGEPFNASWVMEIIKSKENNPFQNAIWFVRRNAGKQAVPMLIQCLDMTDPSVSSYYNYTLVWQIGGCGGPKLKFHHDFDGKGTEEQVQENKKVLQTLTDHLKKGPEAGGPP